MSKVFHHYDKDLAAQSKRIDYAELRAVCPWCGQEFILCCDVLHPEFEHMLRHAQYLIRIHTDPKCGNLSIVYGSELLKYTDIKCSWLMPDKERIGYWPHRGDMFKYAINDRVETRIITELPCEDSECTLNTIRYDQRLEYSPWPVWFRHKKGARGITKQYSIETVEEQTGWKFIDFYQLRDAILQRPLIV